jgi:hypothetical protein
MYYNIGTMYQQPRAAGQALVMLCTHPLLVVQPLGKVFLGGRSCRVVWGLFLSIVRVFSLTWLPSSPAVSFYRDKNLENRIFGIFDVFYHFTIAPIIQPAHISSLVHI